MREQAADVPAGRVGQSAVAALVVEERLAVLPERLVAVHARAVVAEERLRHEGRALAVLPRDVLDDVLEEHQLVGGMLEGVELVVDLTLACRAHLVVRPLDLEADLLQDPDHVVADVSEVIDRRHREVAALVGRLVAQVAALLDAAGVPGPLDRVDVVVRRVLLGLEADVVEDVELRLGAEVRRVGDTRRLEVGLGVRRDVARVAAVGLVRVGVADREVHDDRLRVAEGVDIGGRGIGNQLHV